MRRSSLFFILSLSFIFTAGCSDSESGATEETDVNNSTEEEHQGEEYSNEEEVPEENDGQSEEEVYEVDLDYERFANDPNEVLPWLKLGPGKYSGDDYDEEVARKEVDQWPDGLDPEQYFHYLLALTAEDYTEHQEFLEETEVLFDDISSRPDSYGEEDSETEEDKLHVQILLDASGSMAGQLDGRTKMELAKEAIADFAAELPAEAHVSLRVYGHKGNNRADGKEESCGNTEAVFALGPYDEAAFAEALDQFEPTGFTPIAAAIKEAGEDLLSAHGEGVQSVIYVVSDGEETCGGNPAAEAEQLQDSDIQAVVNIIGFDIEASERAALEAIADAGAGEYFHAETGQELRNTFEQEKTALINEWYSWQSENVNNAYSQQSSYVNDSYGEQSTAVNKSYTEQSRQKNLTYYMNHIMEETDTRRIRELIDARSSGIRDYFIEQHKSFREEAQETGAMLREEIREQGEEERDNLRNNN